MGGDLNTLGDMDKISHWVREIAIKSVKDYKIELIDHADWLNGTEITTASDPINIPEGPQKEIIRIIFSTRKTFQTDSIPPIAGELAARGINTQFGIDDLLLATAIMTPLIEKFRNGGLGDLGNREGIDMGRETVTQIIISMGANWF